MSELPVVGTVRRRRIQGAEVWNIDVPCSLVHLRNTKNGNILEDIEREIASKYDEGETVRVEFMDGDFDIRGVVENDD